MYQRDKLEADQMNESDLSIKKVTKLPKLHNQNDYSISILKEEEE